MTHTKRGKDKTLDENVTTVIFNVTNVTLRIKDEDQKQDTSEGPS